MDNHNRQGKGLTALLGDAPTGGDSVAVGNIGSIAISRIERNPWQPRKNFDDEEIAQLSDSIRAHGVLQPVVVRMIGDKVQLIAGERRLRAAQVAGLTEIPVNIVGFTDQQTLEAALVENIQRTDLNAIEKALSFRQYLDSYQLTQEQLATRLGMDRSSVTNLVNLLSLPAEVQNAVRLNQISLGHAKILKGLSSAEQQIALSREVTLKGLSVKALETLVREQKSAASEDASAQPGTVKNRIDKTEHVLGIETELRQKLAAKCDIKLKSKDKGQIVLAFENTEEFERLVELLRG